MKELIQRLEELAIENSQLKNNKLANEYIRKEEKKEFEAMEHAKIHFENEYNMLQDLAEETADFLEGWLKDTSVKGTILEKFINHFTKDIDSND